MKPSDYQEAATELKKISDEQLASIGKLAAEQVLLEREIEKLEADLKEKNAKLATLAKQTIPEALQQFGLEEVTLASGHKISVSQFYACNISEARKADAHAWLREHGFASLIKNEIIVPLPAGEDETAQQVRDLLQEQGISCETKESVHFQTLKAFVKTQLETPEEENPAKPPLDLFGIFVGKIAKVSKKSKI